MTGSVEHWQVICECSTLEPQDKEDDEGNPTEDPIDWRYDISCSTQLFQVPAWSGWNVDVMNGVPANTFGPIRNSANIVYDPPLMREIPETVLRISGNAWEFWAAILMVNAGSINQFEIAWSNLLCEKYGFVAQSFAPYCVHCTAVGADYRVENGYRFWKYTFEFHMRTPADSVNPQDGFLETILDRGITRAAGSGDPDGKGGIISPSDILEGMAPATAVRDIEDRRIPETVLFDGKGQPLIDLTKPVYFRWRIHPFGAFNYIPLDIFK
jgi:hypothetical protein